MTPTDRKMTFVMAGLVALAALVSLPSAALAAEWSPNTSYAVNTIVTYQGPSYKCIQGHTSLVGWEPPNVPALWGLQSGPVPTPTNPPRATATPTTATRATATATTPTRATATPTNTARARATATSTSRPRPTATTRPTATSTTPPSGGTWRKANLTNFESYPDPDSDECRLFNGCTWEGQFAFVSGKQTEAWVMAHNICAVHQKDAQTYKLKTLRLKQGSKQIDAVVYDMCADSDCSGCCTQNANQGGIGFLIDVEKYTMQRFGTGGGVVDWQCLDCP